jgi:predicted small lipoprotein YifL
LLPFSPPHPRIKCGAGSNLLPTGEGTRRNAPHKFFILRGNMVYKNIIAISLMILALNACGHKGDLFLVDENGKKIEKPKAEKAAE